MANLYGSMPGNVGGGFQLFKGTTARTGGLGQFRPVPHSKQQGTSQTSRPVHDRSVKWLALAEDGRYPSVTGARRKRGGVRQAAAVEEPEVTSIKDQFGAGVVYEDAVQAAAEGCINDLHVGQPDDALSGSTATLSDSAPTSPPRSNADSEGSRPSWNGDGKQRRPQGSDEEYRKGHFRMQEIKPPRSDRVPIPESDVWFKPGDIVEGRVIWVNCYGAKVELLRDKRIVGYAPSKFRPFVQSDTGGAGVKPELGAPCFPEGLVREWKVMEVPKGMTFFDKGPLLSAKERDLDLLLGRLHQLNEACTQDLERIKVKIVAVNNGGAVTVIQGLNAFVPFGRLASRGDFLPMEEARERLVGQELEVMVDEVSRTDETAVVIRVLLNEQKVKDLSGLRQLKVGAVVDGLVRRVEEFGAFVGINGMKVSGLLHISNISRARVDATKDVFKVGDQIRALVIGMDSNYCRISLSTAELELNDGDMLSDPASVFARADDSAKLFNDILQELMVMEANTEASRQGTEDSLDFDNLQGQ
eukprot:jgi/Botrbrau1/16188/Bobra.0342s0005.1